MSDICPKTDICPKVGHNYIQNYARNNVMYRMGNRMQYCSVYQRLSPGLTRDPTDSRTI